jgi:glycosyltransferase involved in cell wall biosynthesis
MKVRVLYLFSGIRGRLVEAVKRGEDPGDGTWGMVRLRHFGVDAEHLELEQILPDKLAKWLRIRLFGNYGAHIPFFFNFFRYDIVFTAGAFYSQLLFTIAKMIFRFKRPLWIMHDFSITGFMGEGKTLRQKVFRFMTANAEGIVAVGKEEEGKLKALFPRLKERITYIPFGVDINFFKPRESTAEERRILSVGVDPDRDWGTLFKACEGLGVPVMAATRPRGSKDITPPSFVTRKLVPLKELVNEYECASIVVIPLDSSAGINDAMGCTALFEALAMGKAVIATSTHTMRSYITHGENGLLVPERDVAAMRAAIQELLADGEKRARLGRAARAYAAAHLDAEKLTGRLAEYFKRMVQ